MLVLGIESSCDETAAAVVRDGREILSSVISSQIDIHRKWGGVVPEIASREHLDKIDSIVRRSITEAEVELTDIDAIAVTQGPGLIGSLLVGVCYAKAMAFALDKPIVGVNHIEGHVYSVNFENPPVQYPALALIVSGGHTNIFHILSEGQYKVVSRTRDDAAGEAFDKAAKMLGLGYPGGPIIERIAKNGVAGKVRFPLAKISDGRPDLSFSGLKTALARYIRENQIVPAVDEMNVSQEVSDIALGFQTAVINALTSRMSRLSLELGPRTLLVAGGVACNLALQKECSALAEKLGLPVYFPSKHLSTDNAAMIAAAGFAELKAGKRAELNMTADISMRLQNVDNEEDALRASHVKYRL